MTRRKPTNIRMALTKRTRNGSHSRRNNPGMGDDDPTNGDEESKKGASTRMVMILLCKIFLVVAIVFGSICSMGGSGYASTALASREGVRKSSKKGLAGGERFVVDERFGVELLLDLQSSSSSSSSPPSLSSYALGPHSAKLLIRKKQSCLDIKFWLQFEGDAMGAVILTEQEDVVGTHNWNGEFYFPTSGTYQLVSYFYGCGDGMGTTTSSVVLKEGVNVPVETGAMVDASGISNPLLEATNDPYLTSILYPNAAWVASHKFGDSYSQNSVTVCLAQSSDGCEFHQDVNHRAVQRGSRLF